MGGRACGRRAAAAAKQESERNAPVRGSNQHGADYDAKVILSGFKTLVHKKPPNHLAADLLPGPRSRCLSRGDGSCQFATTRANPHIQRGLDFLSATACGRIEPID